MKFKFFKSKKLKIVMAVLSAILIVNLFVLFNFKVDNHKTELEKIPFKVEQVNDDTLEVGEFKNAQQGVDGERLIHKKFKRTLWQVLNGQDGDMLEESSEVVKKPVDLVDKKGTKRYQYMICSDGSWRFYTDEQMNSSPEIGFTSKSQDCCAENGQGVKVSLTNEGPQNTTNMQAATNYNYQPAASSTYLDTFSTPEFQEELRKAEEENEKKRQEYEEASRVREEERARREAEEEENRRQREASRREHQELLRRIECLRRYRATGATDEGYGRMICR